MTNDSHPQTAKLNFIFVARLSSLGPQEGGSDENDKIIRALTVGGIIGRQFQKSHINLTSQEISRASVVTILYK